jgi:hypothetical protein
MTNSTAEPLTAVVQLNRTTRRYSGEFFNPREYLLQPAEESHVIGYWSLEILTIEGSDGASAIYYSVKLTSLRTPGQMRSRFSQDYHSDINYHRLSLSLVPEEILEAISEATGETILFD